MSARRSLLLAVLLAIPTTVRADGPLAEGHWRLATVSPAGEGVLAVLKVESKNGKLAAEIVATRPNLTLSVKEIKAQGNNVTITLSNGQSFVGMLGADKKAILGGLGTDRFMNRAKMTATESAELPAANRAGRGDQPESYQKAQQLSSRPLTLRLQAQREQDADKKKELQVHLAAAQKEAEEKVPGLYRETVEKHANTLAGMDAALALLRGAARMKVTAEEAATLVKVVEAGAKPYGPQYTRILLQQLATSLVDQKGFAPIALSLIEPTVQALRDIDPAEQQFQVLTVYHRALANSGRTAEAKETESRLAKLEAKLDNEYRSTMPPFKPTVFSGRKETKANQVVLLELFTGAQCPPCVAADVAFDGLVKSYKPNELLLVQYHMHIPGPDPLTNKDTIARWNYYREKFAKEMRGVPSSVFNGQPKAGGGGSMANGESKYHQYRGIIDGLVEQVTPISISGTASRQGDQVGIAVNVNGIDQPGQDMKLRLLLVEDEVKYTGSNRIRFHHHVVRDMPGGANGLALTDKSHVFKREVNLAGLREKLNQYLDEFAKTRPFPNAKRPMDFNHLKVIAFVQNDKTGEILQTGLIEVVQKEVGAK